MVRPAKPETFGQCLLRVYLTLDRLRQLDVRPDANLLMICHANFMRELLNAILEIEQPVRFSHGNCGMTLLTFETQWIVEYCNRELDSIKGYTFEESWPFPCMVRASCMNSACSAPGTADGSMSAKTSV